jgi:hypothetical protein
MVRRTLLASLLLVVAAAAQAQPYRAPKTPYGQPDLQGVWDNDSLTILERPDDFAGVIATPAEAQKFEAKFRKRYEKVIGPVGADEPAPERDNVQDDDRFEPPPGLARVGGQLRSAQIVDPPYGRLPYRPEARAAADQALKNEEVYDDPEGRPFDERCLLGGGGGVAAPIINRDHVKIVQTRDALVLFGEQNHEARIVRLADRRHLPASVRPWMGDPVGWWEGDTLVIETTNLNPSDAWRWNAGKWIKLGRNTRITERLTRISAREILYSYVVDDPADYTQPWRGEAVFRATTAPMFEYACHEGNYALRNILAGARAQERAASAKPATP